MLAPIIGYEKKPLVSLKQAIQPLLLLVPNVENMVWTVEQNCQNPHAHLSSDESALIRLYTLKWFPRQSSFYFILNEALRSQNRNELLPWFLYLRLFIFALSKLPLASHPIIYRGIKMELTEEFPKGKTFIWWAFSSSTSSIEVLERFLVKRDIEQYLILNLSLPKIFLNIHFINMKPKCYCIQQDNLKLFLRLTQEIN
jgi:hypothetical protein